jgi:riboflavin synthase
MFTGLIETVGRVARVDDTPSGTRLGIDTALSPELSPGDSLSVNGVCLTVTVVEAGGVGADVGPETLRVTTLGRLRRHQAVNLERPMRAGGRFGGHFVQGHVDAMGTLDAVREEAGAHWLTIGFPLGLAPLIIRKGSIAVDGISLTVADLRESQFDVMIVPFTWQSTNLSSLVAGDRVNLECDMVGKYVVRAVETLRT